uniref:U86-Liphistoxin-Lth1a_1 n=1 Tax=Liphistius thaleban TaxID=1905330 RepID=A0A4Q8K1D9_9ARAC
MALAFCLSLFMSAVFLTSSYPKLTRPKLYGEAIPKRDLDTRHHGTKKKIVLMHNFYRSRVDPPASDMLEMSWHKGAQEGAERWAEACQLLIHDGPLGRWVDDYGSCGQNIFVSNVQVPWMFVVKAWFMEHLDFSYGSLNNTPEVIGHYTQMVWYNSHKVGCGFHYCVQGVVKKPFYNYVCNYCPIGNFPKRLGRPYSKGQSCGKCSAHCKYKKLCTNSCPYSDLWTNCAELNVTWNKWLCGDLQLERQQACRATCQCSGKIR